MTTYSDLKSCVEKFCADYSTSIELLEENNWTSFSTLRDFQDKIQRLLEYYHSLQNEEAMLNALNLFHVGKQYYMDAKEERENKAKRLNAIMSDFKGMMV